MTLLLLYPCCAPDEPILIKNRHNNIFRECDGFSATTKFTKTVEMDLEKGRPIVVETLVYVPAPRSTPERVKGEKKSTQQIYV